MKFGLKSAKFLVIRVSCILTVVSSVYYLPSTWTVVLSVYILASPSNRLTLHEYCPLSYAVTFDKKRTPLSSLRRPCK